MRVNLRDTSNLVETPPCGYTHQAGDRLVSSWATVSPIRGVVLGGAVGDRFRVDLSLDQAGGWVRAGVFGDLDVSTVEVFSAVLGAVGDLGYRHLVLDVCGVDSVDATGIGILRRARAHYLAMGGRLTLIRANPGLTALLELAGLPPAPAVSAVSIRRRQRCCGVAVRGRSVHPRALRTPISCPIPAPRPGSR